MNSKVIARRLVNGAVRRGEITRPDICQRCGNRGKRIVAHHHRGYEGDAALDVRWLCDPCHSIEHQIPQKAWETKRARGYQQPSVTVMSGQPQSEMSRRGWETRRQTSTPDEIAAQCARGGAAPRHKKVIFVPVKCTDCGRNYSGAWIGRHKREGHCVPAVSRTCIECGASFMSRPGYTKQTCSRLCTNRVAVKVRVARHGK
jgi:hypothetical protein